MKCPKIKKRLAIYVAIGFILIIISGPLLVTQDNLQNVDAIVVIGGDHKPDRVKRAVELYQQGYAPVVIISAGTQVLKGGVTLPEAIVMRNQALGLGLPEQVIVLEQESQSTLQNAIYTKTICQTHGIRSIILVTSVYHSRRAQRIFQDIMGKDILLVVQPAPPNYCSVCGVVQPDQMYVVLYEYQNWIRYWTKWDFQ
jgi:uncharacterized SAM-binding protein YcdF (DUF218 family)